MKWYKNGLQFSCTRCSACCRHQPGYVFLSEQDIANYLIHFNLDRKSFLETYCRTVNFGFTQRISLIEKKNFDCIFWDKGCTTYTARPLQCRAFPFWSSVMSDKAAWDETAQNCPGMNNGTIHDVKEIDTWLEARLQEPFVEE